MSKTPIQLKLELENILRSVYTLDIHLEFNDVFTAVVKTHTFHLKGYPILASYIDDCKQYLKDTTLGELYKEPVKAEEYQNRLKEELEAIARGNSIN